MGQIKQKMLDENTGFPVGFHGGHSHAVDYMLDRMEADPGNQVEFLRAWREGNLEEWPEYYEHLHTILDPEYPS
jgi:hypothetical protein